MTYTPEQAAAKIGVATSTLAKWRLAGGDATPRYYKLGRAVRYSPEAVTEWLASRERTSTSEAR
ncbi:MAG: helix-turn-helix domain-containing protein [Phenylobacterium sp.]|jgi:predicted DNA-binding transcriptional regulator AlpA|nr:helix-turn-helix domain-containing protein [Phenylobacterium sp.]